MISKMLSNSPVFLELDCPDGLNHQSLQVLRDLASDSIFNKKYRSKFVVFGYNQNRNLVAKRYLNIELSRLPQARVSYDSTRKRLQVGIEGATRTDNKLFIEFLEISCKCDYKKVLSPLCGCSGNIAFVYHGIGKEDLKIVSDLEQIERNIIVSRQYQGMSF